MKIQGVLLDKDGTLFDFVRSWADWTHALLLHLARAGGQPAWTTAARLAGDIRFDLSARRFAPDSPVIAGTAREIAAHLAPSLPALTETAIAAEIDARARDAPMVPAVPLVPFLNDLRARGLRLGVATNASEGEARTHLQNAGIGNAFDYVAGADSGYGAKPAPGMCLGFVEATGLAHARIAMVGDSLHDLKAGRAAGMVTVGVLTGLATEADLAPMADVVLPDIGHLSGWLDQHGRQ